MCSIVTMLAFIPTKFYGGRKVGGGGGGNRNSESESCEKWLEREDAVTYSRDFAKEPVFVSGADQVWLILIVIISFFVVSVFMKKYSLFIS